MLTVTLQRQQDGSYTHGAYVVRPVPRALRGSEGKWHVYRGEQFLHSYESLREVRAALAGAGWWYD